MYDTFLCEGVPVDKCLHVMFAFTRISLYKLRFRFGKTTSANCESSMQNMKLLLSLLLATFSAANDCSAGDSPNSCSLIDYPPERHDGPMLIEFIKNQTFNKGTLFNEWLTKITRLDTARRSGTAIKVSFYAAPTQCRTVLKVCSPLWS
ncbi:hypothetical protein D918_00199 [Trichuris suis]|nr:hypothetical protein D918_00199 [Trichuris suis]